MLFLLLLLCTLVTLVTPANIGTVGEDCLLEICTFLNGDINTRLASRQLMHSYDESRLWRIQSLNVKLSVSNEACDTAKFLVHLNDILASKPHFLLRKKWDQELCIISQQKKCEVDDESKEATVGSVCKAMASPSNAVDLEIQKVISVIKAHVNTINSDMWLKGRDEHLLLIYEWLKRALPGFDFRDQVAPVINFSWINLLIHIFVYRDYPTRNDIFFDLYRGESLRCNFKRTMLMDAIHKRDVGLACGIIQRVDSNFLEFKDTTGLRALHYAAKAGSLELVMMLVERKVTINIVDKTFKYPIHYAIHYGHMEVVLCLVNAGANINRPECGRSCLEVAQSVGNTDMMEYFRKLEQVRRAGEKG